MKTLLHRHWRSTTLIVIACIILFWVVHFHFRPASLPYDDAFIAYRYVENFTQGDGLVYNLGERAWGYSTVTYVFWLAAWHRILPNVPLPDLAVRTNVLPFAAVGVAIFLLVLRYSGTRALAVLVAALVLLNPSLLAISTGGMESFLFVALALFSLLAAAADRPGLAGILAGLSFLTRVEGLVLAPLLFLCFWRRRHSLIKMTVSMAALPAAWIAFASAYYGTFVPHSILAKSRPLYVLEPLSASIAIVNNLTLALFPVAVAGYVFILFPLSLCTIACLSSAPLRAKGAWTVPLFFWGVFGMYSYGNPLLFEWYWPFLLVPALLTLALGASALSSSLSNPHRPRQRLAASLIIGSWAVWMITANIHGWRFQRLGFTNSNWPVNHIDSEPGRLRTRTYREAALWLNRHRRPDDTVLAPEIGALGYYLKGPLIDACGLVSPEVIRYLPVPSEERLNGSIGSIPLAFVRDLQPDYIVTMPVFAQKNVLDDPWARRTYTIATEFRLPLPTYGSDRVLVLKRNQPLPQPSRSVLEVGNSRGGI